MLKNNKNNNKKINPHIKAMNEGIEVINSKKELERLNREQLIKKIYKAFDGLKVEGTFNASITVMKPSANTGIMSPRPITLSMKSKKHKIMGGLFGSYYDIFLGTDRYSSLGLRTASFETLKDIYENLDDLIAEMAKRFNADASS